MFIIETKQLIIKPLTYQELKTYIIYPETFEKQNKYKVSKQFINNNYYNNISKEELTNCFSSDDYIFYTLWIFIEKQSNNIIGDFYFHGKPNEKGKIDFNIKIFTNYQKQAYTSEALNEIIMWCYLRNDIYTIQTTGANSNNNLKTALLRLNFAQVDVSIEQTKWEFRR